MEDLISTRDLVEVLLSLLIALTASGVIALLRPKSRIQWSSTNQCTFAVPKIPPQDTAVEQVQSSPDPAKPITNIPDEIYFYTQTIFVQNTGRGIAHKVELIFNYHPEHYQFWPIVPYDIKHFDDGRFLILIDQLAPKESFSIEMLSMIELPSLLRIRTPVGDGKEIMMIPSSIPTKRDVRIALALMISGATALVYIAIQILTLI